MAPTGTAPSHKTAAASIKGKSAMVDTMPQRAAAAAERAHADGGDETANARTRVNSLALNHHNVAAQPSSRPAHPCAASASSPTPCYSSPSRPIAKLATCTVHSRPQARRRAPVDSKQQALR